MKRLAGIVVLLLLLVLGDVLLFSFRAWASEEELAEIQDAIRSKGARWVAGETSVSKLPPEQRRAMLGALKSVLTGTKPLSPKGGRSQLSASATATPPPAFDWRNSSGKNFVTPVRNQGDCGSCWAFATTAALESYVLITQNTPGTDVNLSEQTLVSCGGAGNCGGGDIFSASSYIKSTGLPVEACFPYTAKDPTTGAPCSNACSTYRTSTYKIYDWSQVPSSTVSDIKTTLCTYGPLVTTMDVYADFFSYHSGVYSYVSGAYQGGHAILIVGYNDPGQYFIVKNSWGTGWGESGYFRIAYSEMSSVVLFGEFTIAYEAPAAFSYTLNTNPTGLQVTVDGSTYASPYAFTGTAGSVHTIGTPTPQLSANGRTRYVFSSWSDGGGQIHQVTAPSSNTTYLATFTTQYSLSTGINPSGTGSVTLNPSNTWYNAGQGVQLTAAPNTGYSFSGWSGDLLGTTNPATVTMDGPKTVTANFTQNQYSLAATGNPSCSGWVTKIPDKATYVYGETVQLVAVASPDYAFSGWGGDASGSVNPVTISINGNKVVRANFNTGTPPASQGQWKIRFLTETGDTITTTSKAMGYYFINDEDITLTILLQDPLNFIPTCPDIGILDTPAGNCTFPGDGSVTANAGQSFSFVVGSSTSGATLSAQDLPINGSGTQATFNPANGLFQWSTAQGDAGTYLVVFQAAVTNPSLVSQFVVSIDITP